MSAGWSKKEQQLPLTVPSNTHKELDPLRSPNHSDLIQISAITVQTNTSARKHCRKKSSALSSTGSDPHAEAHPPTCLRKQGARTGEAKRLRQ